MKPFSILLLAAASGLLFSASCSSSDKSGSNADTGPAGGPVPGAADDHCTGTPTVVDPAACMGTSTDTGAGGAADGDTGGSSAGAADCTQTRDVEYGPTLPNSEGDDDDCKYHASWTSTPIRVNEDVTFTLTASNKTTMLPLAPLSDGDIPLSRVDVYEPCTGHFGPAQDFKPNIAQTMPGQFTIGPIKFDASGLWVVRFHLYEECNDTDTSPHGHIAFFVNVP